MRLLLPPIDRRCLLWVGYRIRLLALLPTHVALIWVTVVFFVRYLLPIAGWALLLCVSVILLPLFFPTFVLVLIVAGFLLSALQLFCKCFDLSFVDEP